MNRSDSRGAQLLLIAFLGMRWETRTLPKLVQGEAGILSVFRRAEATIWGGPPFPSIHLGVETASARGPSGGAGEPIDEVIEDDSFAPKAPPRSPRSEPTPSTFYARGVTRATLFLNGNGEGSGTPLDRYETRTFLFVGAKSSAQEKNAWRIELRSDLLGRSLANPSSDNSQAWDLEARPWEAWWRAHPSETTRLKLGFQSINWGVLDVGAASDVFASFDLRLGPALTPAEVRMPVPAAVVSWSPSSRVDVELAALPFFTPHRFDLTGTRYAALSPQTLGPLAQAFDRGTLTRITDGIARANGIDARPDHGELGLRITVHLARIDLAVTAAAPRNRFPSYRVSEAFEAVLRNPTAPALFRMQQELDAGIQPIAANYARYMQFAVDAQGSWGSVPWGAELGLSSRRELVSSTPLSSAPAPRAHVFQGGLRASKVWGDLTVAGQAAVYTLLNSSSDGGSVVITPILFGDRRTTALAVASLRYELRAFFFEASALGLCGGPELASSPCASTTILATGRAGYGTDDFSVSLGGTGIRSSNGKDLPLNAAIDQLVLRLDFTPPGR